METREREPDGVTLVDDRSWNCVMVPTRGCRLSKFGFQFTQPITLPPYPSLSALQWGLDRSMAPLPPPISAAYGPLASLSGRSFPATHP